jgi:two-component system chemotaxis response regulator CheY
VANVLIVDDIAIMRNVIKRHLIKLGHTVVAEAENGHNAVIQYKRFNPDIVTMDVTMPAENGVKNGIDALKLIKEYDNNAKIVMVTSHGEEKLVMEALMTGAKGYILKPVNEEKLKTIFDKLTISPISNIVEDVEN